MTGRTSAASGSVAVLASFAAIAVLNYVFAIAMSWLLPVVDFGVLGVAQAILLVGATVVSAGIPLALTREAAVDADGLRGSVLRAGLVGNVAFGIVLGAAVAAAGATGLVQPAGAYAVPFVAVGVTIAVLALNAALLGVLQGTLRLGTMAVARTVEVVVKVLAGLALVALGLGAAGAVAGFLLGAVASTALAAARLRSLRLAPGAGAGLVALVRRAAPLFVGVSAFALLSQADVLALKGFTPPTVSEFLTGQYQVAVTLARLPYFAGLALFGAVFPYVARHAGTELGGGYARTALRYAFLALIPATIVLATIPDPVIRVFFSAKYDASAEGLRGAAIATGILTIGLGLGTLLQAAGRPRLVAAVLVAAVVVQLGLASVTVPAWGMVGTAAALGTAGLIVVVGLLPAARRAFMMKPSVGDAAAYLASLGVLGVTLLVLPTNGTLATVCSTITGLAAYTVAITVAGLLTSDDARTITGAIGAPGRIAMPRITSTMDALRQR
ncbi:MAG TPA: oligosaccharide flippase family protein [Candidatus Limnocylindrales bacterium]